MKNTRLTELEKFVLDGTHRGMDEYGCGWLHQLTIQTLSDHQVAGCIGSLEKKGILTSHHELGTPGCYWIKLTQVGWETYRQLAKTDEQSVNKYGCLIKTRGKTIYTRPTESDDWIEVTAPDSQEFLDFVYKHFGVWSLVKQYSASNHPGEPGTTYNQ